MKLIFHLGRNKRTHLKAGVGVRSARKARRKTYSIPDAGAEPLLSMSAFGAKRTFRSLSVMSAFGGKADIEWKRFNVCF